MANQRLRASFIDYGARLHRLSVFAHGQWRDVIVSLPNASDYRSDMAAMGAVVGPYANRIAYGRLQLAGNPVQLDQNHGEHHLHGGAARFDHKVWFVDALSDGLKFSHVTKAGEGGYEGVLEVSLKVTLLDCGLQYEYLATTSEPTVINLTNHSYFNLSETDADIGNHRLQIFDEQYVAVDATAGDYLPNGQFAAISKLGLDAHKPILLSDLGGGLDHCIVLEGALDSAGLHAAAELECDGIVLTVSSSEPGLQVYTGEFLTGPHVKPRAGICLETQHFPDSPNHKHFPSVSLMPGQVFRSISRYEFESV